MAAPLPPLPEEFEWLEHQPNISFLSRKLNLLFSFAVMETTERFPTVSGPQGFLAIQGCVYHRVRPTNSNSGLRWLLFDGWMQDDMPRQDWANLIPVTWTNAVATALLRVNRFAREVQIMSTLPIDQCPEAHIAVQDWGTVEIAALLHLDNTVAQNYSPRTMVIRRVNGEQIQIASKSQLWEPLAYPLLFPHSTLGWGIIDGANDFNNRRQRVSSQFDDFDGIVLTQIWHYRARLLREPRFEIFGRLANEYLVDMWTREIDCRLAYIRSNQLRIRQEDEELMGVCELSPSLNVFLPSSFLGSHRWCSEQIADALAIASNLGNLTFFITMTANPNWPKISECLHPGQTCADIPMAVVRCFHS